MTQQVFPEIQPATSALEQRIRLTEAEIVQLNEAISEKKKLIKGLKKGTAAVKPAAPKQAATAS